MKRWAYFTISLALAVDAAAAPGDGFDTERYSVDLTVDYGQRSITGKTDIALRVTAPRLQAIEFTPNQMEIQSASLNGRPVAFTQREGSLAFISERWLRRGTRVQLRVAYRAPKARGVTYGSQSVYSNWFACDWMICLLDKPSDKAAIDVSLTVPGGQQTLGPGSFVGKVRLEDGRETHRWRSIRPYSSYLYSFAAGPFTEWQAKASGQELRVFSETADVSRLERMFRPTADMLRFFEDRAGVSFPWRSYAQLHVAGSAAQESIGFSLIGEPQISPIIDTPEEDWVIAHELAHQWWGNLVTCASWQDLWLNEGVVTFLTAAWKEQRWGRSAYGRELDLARRRVQRAKGDGIDVPLTFAGPYPSLQHRRAITYSKGALFLDALRQEIGDQAFWAALKRFTRRHVGGVATSRDFQQAAERASSRDLSQLFDLWVY